VRFLFVVSPTPAAHRGVDEATREVGDTDDDADHHSGTPSHVPIVVNR